MSEDTPLVSVVVPAYNQADYLAAAIESVLSQDYPAVELIVLNDGSTDATREVLQHYAGRFYFESHTNIGQAATLNKGWRMAKGGILSYLAADDTLAPHAVSASVRALLAHPDVVMTYGDFNLIDPSSRFIRRVQDRGTPACVRSPTSSTGSASASKDPSCTCRKSSLRTGCTMIRPLLRP
jgi:glycosyltransferase involved in cell wall biosynthesis